jgi:hypothetical protein
LRTFFARLDLQQHRLTLLSLARLLLKLLAIVLVALPLGAQTSIQNTIHIPTQQPTIQSAIDAANPGDTLLVEPGIYLENLDFHGKAITVASAEGPSLTILDGGLLAPTVTFQTNEVRTSTLSGFTIRNGAPSPAPGSHGAGVLILHASPTLTGNVFTDNRCAAIDATESAPLITSNVITRTHPNAACVAQAIAPITLTGDPASTLLATLTGNTIESNNLTGTSIQPNAGAIALLAAHATLQSNILRFNIVPQGSPAGIQILENPTTLGGLQTLIAQNLIYSNTTQCGAGGISVSILNPADDTQSATPHVEVQILNNTIADNLTQTTCDPRSESSEASLAPGYLPAQIVLANNIFAASSSHPALLCSTALPTANFHHNLIANTTGPALACPDSGANLLTDPQFQDRATANYHPALTSPAVDSGSNAASPPSTQDLDETPRLQNATDKPLPIIDLGPYEYPAPHTLTASTVVLNASLTTSEAFQPITLAAQVTTSGSSAATGTVTFTATVLPSTVVTLATVPIDATGSASFVTTSLPSASYLLAATYSGSLTLAPAVSAPLLETINPATTLLAFSLTPSNAGATQPITLAARLTAPLSTHIPTGAVQFFQLPPAPAAPVSIGAATVDFTGQATLSMPNMPTGTYQITAVYPGTPNFAPVNLPAADALTLTISLRDYAVALSTASLSVQTQHQAAVILTFTSLGNFADTLNLSCTNLPTAATCTFASATPALAAASTATATLTLETSALPGYAQTRQPSLFEGSPRPSILTLAGLLPAGLLSLSSLLSKRNRSRSLPRSLLLLLLLMVGPIALNGCSGKLPAATPPGTYQINVISTAATTGLTHTTQLTLVVTP